MKEIKAYAVAVEPDFVMAAIEEPGSEAEKRFKRINERTQTGRYGVNVDAAEAVIFYLYDTKENRDKACRIMIAEGINAAIIERPAFIPMRIHDPRKLI